MSLQLPFGVKVLNQEPVDNKYLNEGVAYTGITQVNTLLPSGIRHIGLTVNINNVEYWYATGIDDSDLVEKTPSVVAGGGITGATNGLSKTGDAKVALGGALTGDTTISGASSHSLVFDDMVNFTVNGNHISLNVVGSGEEPLSTWILRDSNSFVNDVIFANNLFVAVGDSTIYTSPDGITWTDRVSPSPRDWRSIAYGAGLYVAVAFDGTNTNQVMTSPDGINWTLRTSASDQSWKDVTFGGGLFVAVADDNVMTSPDGITWTLQSPPVDTGFTYSWSAVAYGNGVYTVVAQSGEVMTSPDAVTWTLRTPSSGDFWEDIAYGNGLFAAVAASNNDANIMTSPDGINWTNRSYVGASYKTWRKIIYANDMFVAIADTFETDDILMSADGITWELVNGISPDDTTNYDSIAFGNDIFVATSLNGNIITSPASSGGSGEIVSLVIAESGSTFTDGRDVTKGIEYAADYSAGFAKHTLVDNHYVTGITSTIEANSITTANNGLTKSGNNVRLGGILTGDTVISGASHSLTLGSLTPESHLNVFEVNADTVEIWGENGLNLYGDGTSGVFVGSLDSKTVVDASDGLGDNSAKIEATPTNMLIKVEDQNHTADASINMDTQTVDLKVLEGGEAMNQILIDIDSIDITQTNGINGINIHTVGNLNLNADGINVETAGSGMTYLADYSAGFSKHSIVDVNYVTGLTTTSGVQTANNGLTKNGTNVRLGGALTGDTSIDANGNSFTIENYDGGLFLNDTTGGGTWIQDTGAGGVYIDSDGGISIDAQDGGVSLRADGDFNGIILDARDASQVSRTNLYLSPTVARFSDSRTGSTAVGIVYNADYSANFTNRSLVDKEYVDNLAAGLDPKEAVKVATAAELTGATYVATGGTFGSGAFTSAPSIVDGYTVVVGDRILVKNQSDLKQNGIYYVVSASNWYRATDMDGTPANEVSTGNFVFVTTGNTNVASGWVVVGSGDTLTLNVDDVKWAQFSAAIGAYLAGDGIDIVGATISVDLAVNGGLEISGEELQLSSSIAGDGLDYASGVLSLDLASSGGLEISSGELQLSSSIAGDGIDYNAGVISLDANVAGDGLDYNAGVISLDANVAGDGLDYNAGVISVSSEILNGVHTANNGLTKNGTNVRLGGTLTGDTGIDGAFNLSLGISEKSGAVSTSPLGIITLSANNGLYFEDAGGGGSYFYDNNGGGIYFEQTGEGGFYIENDYDINLHSENTDGSLTSVYMQHEWGFDIWKQSASGVTANGVESLMRLRRTIDFPDTPENGFGLKVELQLANNAGGWEQGAGISYVASDVANATFSAHMDFEIHDNNVVKKVLELNGDGALYPSDFSSGFTKHSLVDVNYVTGLTTTSGVQTANNGLTKSGTNVYLGGELTGDTNITTTGVGNSSTVSLGTGFNAALGVSSEYNDGFTMGTSAFEVKHFQGVTASFDDQNGTFNQLQVRSSGIEATSNGGNFSIYSHLDISNANQYGKAEERPQIYQSLVLEDTVHDVLFSEYGYDIHFRDNNDNSLTRFILTTTGTTFTDGRTGGTAGIEYAADYSVGFEKHSLVDVNYVTGLTSTIEANSITTANNGLTKSGNNVRLGGEITGSTYLTWTDTSFGNVDNSVNFMTGTLGSNALEVSADYQVGLDDVETTFTVSGPRMRVTNDNRIENIFSTVDVKGSGLNVQIDTDSFSKWSNFNVGGNTNIHANPAGPAVTTQIYDGISMHEFLISEYGIEFNINDGDVDADVANFLITKTGTTYTDGRTGGTAGIEYAADYSAGFEKHSLVDVNYVTGLTSSIKVNKLTVGSVSGNTTLTDNDHVVMVNTSSTGATISLPASPQDGQVYHIKDKSGNALSNSIVISGNGKNIDGASTATINTDYGSLYIVFSESDNEWYTLAFIN